MLHSLFVAKRSAMLLKACVFVPLLFSSAFGGDVDMDYYYSSALRSQTIVSCKSLISLVQCQNKCDMKPALCIESKCYCTSIDTETSPDDNSPEMESLYALRPTVRHHIAHFCPNLDVARTCIRKCMAQGKPAFCGKDHVCYCGHKYTHTGKDDGGDSKKIYAQFKDLYLKYFGPEYKGSAELQV